MDIRQATQMIHEWRGSLGVCNAYRKICQGASYRWRDRGCRSCARRGARDDGRNGELLWDATAHTLMGELRLANSDRGQAETETCFRRAIDAARRHNTRMWDLRAVPRLTRLWQRRRGPPRCPLCRRLDCSWGNTAADWCKGTAAWRPGKGSAAREGGRGAGVGPVIAYWYSLFRLGADARIHRPSPSGQCGAALLSPENSATESTVSVSSCAGHDVSALFSTAQSSLR